MYKRAIAIRPERVNEVQALWLCSVVSSAINDQNLASVVNLEDFYYLLEVINVSFLLQSSIAMSSVIVNLYSGKSYKVINYG